MTEDGRKDKTSLYFDLEPLTKVKLIGGKFYVMECRVKDGNGWNYWKYKSL